MDKLTKSKPVKYRSFLQARKHIPVSFNLVELFGWTLGGFYLAQYGKWSFSHAVGHVLNTYGLSYLLVTKHFNHFSSFVSPPAAAASVYVSKFAEV